MPLYLFLGYIVLIELHPGATNTKADWEPTQSALCACFVRLVYFFAFFTGVRGTAFTALSSTAVSLAAGFAAPVGIRLVVTV